jgi:hypothetical protein
MAAAFHPHTTLGVGIALVLVTCATVWAAAIRPQLRVAPVTAAIVLLTDPAGAPVEQFVLDRIIEIGGRSDRRARNGADLSRAITHLLSRAPLPSWRVSSGCCYRKPMLLSAARLWSLH